MTRFIEGGVAILPISLSTEPNHKKQYPSALHKNKNKVIGIKINNSGIALSLIPIIFPSSPPHGQYYPPPKLRQSR